MGKSNFVDGYKFDEQDQKDYLNMSSKEASRIKINRRKARKAKQHQRTQDALVLGD